MNDNDVDVLLKRAAATWHAEVTPASAADFRIPEKLAPSRRKLPAQVTVAAAAAAAIVVAIAVAVPLVWPWAGPTDGSGVVADGGSVAGTGYLELSQGRYSLCADLGQALGESKNGGGPTCNGPTVPIRGLDMDNIPGWTVTGTGGYSGLVSITGWWVDRALVVRDVRTQVAPVNTIPAVTPESCAIRPGPWTGSNPDPEAVRNEIDSHPDLYSGMWLADGIADGVKERVLMISVVGDVEQARSTLMSDGPGNLCIVRGQSTIAERQAAAAELSRLQPGWRVSDDPQHGSLIVQFPVLDAEARAVLDRFQGLVSLSPLLSPQ